MIKFIKKYFVYILVLILVIVLAFLKIFKSKPKDKNGTADAELNSLGVNDNFDYKTTALNLAHHLGTAYSPYDPRSWSENDQEVYDIMKNLTQAQFDVVAHLYFTVYAKGKTLSADLARLLDSSLYEKLTVK